MSQVLLVKATNKGQFFEGMIFMDGQNVSFGYDCLALTSVAEKKAKEVGTKLENFEFKICSESSFIIDWEFIENSLKETGVMKNCVDNSVNNL